MKEALWGGHREGGLDVEEQDRGDLALPPGILHCLGDQVDGVGGCAARSPAKLIVSQQGFGPCC